MFNFKAYKETKRFGYDDSTENSENDEKNVGSLEDEEEEEEEEETTGPTFKPDSLNSILNYDTEEESVVIESITKKPLKKATGKNSEKKQVNEKITKKKKKIKKSGAQDKAQQQQKRKTRDIENESEEEAEEKERPKFVKLSTSKAKLDTSRLTFDELYDDFETQDPGELDANRRPPYVSKLDDADLEKLIDWQRRKIASENRLKEDPMYQFIQLVAAYTHTNIKQYITIPAGGGSRLTVGPGGTSAVSGSSPVKMLGSPSYGNPAGLKREITQKENQFLDTVTKRSRLGKERTIWDLLEDPEYENSAKELLKKREMFESLDWVEDVQTTGIMDISPMIYGHVVMAHDLIKLRIPRLSHYSIEELATHPDLRVRFAQLTAVLVDLSKFLSPTRSQLDKNYARLQHQKTMILYSLEQWNNSR